MLNIKLKELLYRILEKFVVSSQTLATGVTLYRYGNMRVLEVAATSVSSNTIATIPSADRPSILMHSVIRHRTSDQVNFYYGLLTVQTNGTVSASYCTATGAYNISAGQVYGSITWIVAN